MVYLQSTFSALIFHSCNLLCYRKVNSPTTVHNTQHMPFVFATKAEPSCAIEPPVQGSELPATKKAMQMTVLYVFKTIAQRFKDMHCSSHTACYLCLLWHWRTHPPSVFTSSVTAKWSQILIGSVWLWHLLPYWLSLRIDVFPLMNQELMSRLYNGGLSPCLSTATYLKCVGHPLSEQGFYFFNFLTNMDWLPIGSFLYDRSCNMF